MKNQLKYLFLLLIPVLQACPPIYCGDPQTIKFPPISESILSLNPYADGDTVYLKHSAGQSISFITSRTKTEQMASCTECCDAWIYEEDATVLLPDYPIGDFQITISGNENGQADFYFFFAGATADIWFCENCVQPVDSVVIDGETFLSVYQLKFDSYLADEQKLLSPDSLYFNKDYGIIKLTMSNGEYYQHFEE